MLPFLIWTCALFVLALQPPVGKIKGKVLDSEGASISGARVLIHWDHSGAGVGLSSNVGLGEDLVIGTDANGDFTPELPPGFYDVFVTATAFSPDCRKIRIRLGETATYTPKLKADPLVTKELGHTYSQ